MPGPRKPAAPARNAKPGNPARISLPIHGNHPLKTGLLRHLLKLSGIGEDELLTVGTRSHRQKITNYSGGRVIGACRSFHQWPRPIFSHSVLRDDGNATLQGLTLATLRLAIGVVIENWFAAIATRSHVVERAVKLKS